MTTARVFSGVTKSGVYVRDGDGLRVFSGGVANEVIVLGGGVLSPAPGGIVENVDVRSFGYLVGSGELAGSNTIEGSVADVTLVGYALVEKRSNDVTVTDGGVEVIEAEAVMSGGIISSGGLLDLAGRHVGHGEILSGGTLELASVGNGLVVQSGGLVDFQGLLKKKLIYSAAVLHSPISLDGATLSSGARLLLDSLTVVSGGILSLTVDAPVLGSVTIESGGRLIGPGAVDSAAVAGSVSGADIVGHLDVVSGGAGRDDIVGRGAVEAVGHGVVSGETILQFGELDVFEGFEGGYVDGRAVATVVRGGTIVVSGFGATASGTVLSSGSRELLTDVATDTGTRILAGAREIVAGGLQRASAFNTLISSGGLELVSGHNAYAVSATVFGGGVLSVTGSGALLGGLLLDGGSAIVSGIADAGQTISFGASGTLELGNLPAFGAAISGLSTSAQRVDLDGFVSSTSETASWTQSGTSGTLTVTDGINVAALTLIGSYTTSDFTLTADGHGGTFVFDPHTSPAATRLAQAAAGLHGGRFGEGAVAVRDGGREVTDTQPFMAAISSR